MMGPMFPVAVGVDWAQDSVQVCALEAGTGKEWQREFPTTGTGLCGMTGWLEETTGRELGEMGVAIERPEGPVVEHLRNSGLAVHHLKASQVRAMRMAFDASQAKDDRRDARWLAMVLERHPQTVRLVEAPNPLWVRLRRASRKMGRLKKLEQQFMLAIQDALRGYFPELLGLLGGQPMSAPWFLDLVLRVETPKKAKKVWTSTLEDVVRRHGLRRFDAASLKAALTVPPLMVSAAEVRGLVEDLRIEVGMLKDLLKRKARLKAERDALVVDLVSAADRARAEAGKSAEGDVPLFEVFNSMTGMGPEVLATMLAEGGEAFLRGEYRKVRQLAGVAPVTVSSGKKKVVRRRRARNPRLATAVFQAARVHAQADAGGRAYYERLRRSGSDRGTAVRKVGDRMLRVLMAMVRDRTRYDESRWAPEEATAPGRGVDEGAAGAGSAKDASPEEEGGHPGGSEEEGTRAEDEGSGATGVRRPREVRPQKSGAPPVGPGRELVIDSTPLVGDGAPLSTPTSSIRGSGLRSG